MTADFPPEIMQARGELNDTFKEKQSTQNSIFIENIPQKQKQNKDI